MGQNRKSRPRLRDVCLTPQKADIDHRRAKPEIASPIRGTGIEVVLALPGVRRYPFLAEDKLMANLYFEDLEVGASRSAGRYLVTKSEIIQFAKQYDPVSLHIDEEAAARSVFGGLTATAAHTFSIFLLLATRLQPPLHALAGLGYDELTPGRRARSRRKTSGETRSQSPNPTGEFFAFEPSCAIKGARRCWNVSPIFSLRGDPTRTRRPALKRLTVRDGRLTAMPSP